MASYSEIWPTVRRGTLVAFLNDNRWIRNSDDDSKDVGMSIASLSSKYSGEVMRMSQVCVYKKVGETVVVSPVRPDDMETDARNDFADAESSPPFLSVSTAESTSNAFCNGRGNAVGDVSDNSMSPPLLPPSTAQFSSDVVCSGKAVKNVKHKPHESLSKKLPHVTAKKGQCELCQKQLLRSNIRRHRSICQMKFRNVVGHRTDESVIRCRLCSKFTSSIKDHYLREHDCQYEMLFEKMTSNDLVKQESSSTPSKRGLSRTVRKSMNISTAI